MAALSQSRRPSRIALAMLVLSVAVATSAHVGTSNAYFDGLAGPYGIRVIIRTPGVIPGLAEASVRVTSGHPVDQITVRPLRSDVGLAGSPRADVAQPVPGDTSHHSAELWLMTAGSYSIEVAVTGPAGEGTALIPVLAIAERRLDMHPALGVALVGGALFLFVGAITIFGAAVRESVLSPGAHADGHHRRRGRIAMIVGGLALSSILWGGWFWWDEVDAAYRDRLYRPWTTSASVATTAGGPMLTLAIDDPEWNGRRWTPLMPDHGKLMHMFMVKAPDMSAFAHLHPVPDATVENGSVFSVPLPTALPPGDYRIYADIVHETGFAPTLVDRVRVPAAARPDPAADRRPLPDPDDSFAELLPIGQGDGDVYRLSSGRTVRWERMGHTVLTADAETTLRFSVTEETGAPSVLSLYMGMLSHAAVVREDGEVFVHLHPGGSINMAAQALFEQAEGVAQTAPSHEDHTAQPARVDATTHIVTFPFVFPTAGRYRIVMQVNVDGVIESAAFDADVAPDAS